MQAEQYAREVERVVRQVEEGTLELVHAWPRLHLLTIAYRDNQAPQPDPQRGRRLMH